MRRDSKPEIEYPCEWAYKVITSDKSQVVAAMESIAGAVEYRLNDSNRSRTGKYVSLSVVLMVDDQEHRDEVYRGLVRLSTVKLVL